MEKDPKEKINILKCDEDGDLVFRDYYCIEKFRMQEPDWIVHMYHKCETFEEFGQFVAGFLTWCAKNKVENLTIDTNIYEPPVLDKKYYGF